jgi:hypothetical protein
MARFFATLKSEWTDSQRDASREQAKHAVIRFIEME